MNASPAIAALAFPHARLATHFYNFATNRHDECRLAATGQVILPHPDGHFLTVVRTRRAGRRNGPVYRRQRAKIRHQGANVFFVPVRRMVPDHPLLMQRPAVR